MSSFKKMRIIQDPGKYDQQSKEISHPNYITSKHMRRLSDLDTEISDILNSDLDDFEKARSYSGALRKFITFKRKFEEDEERDKQKIAQYIKKVTVPKISKIPKSKIPSKVKKVRVKKKITPKKTPKFKKPSNISATSPTHSAYSQSSPSTSKVKAYEWPVFKLSQKAKSPPPLTREEKNKQVNVESYFSAEEDHRMENG